MEGHISSWYGILLNFWRFGIHIGRGVVSFAYIDKHERKVLDDKGEVDVKVSFVVGNPKVYK